MENDVKKSVKRFELSNGLDTALYKNYLFYFLPSALKLKAIFCIITHNVCKPVLMWND